MIQTDDHADGTVEETVRTLACELGRGRRQRDLLRECRDGLEDAAAAHQRAGLSRRAAEELAVAEFGDIGSVAAALRTETHAADLSRTSWVLGLSYPAIMIIWWLAPAGELTMGRGSDFPTQWGFLVLCLVALATASGTARLLWHSARHHQQLRHGRWLPGLLAVVIGGLTLAVAQWHDPFVGPATSLAEPAEWISGVLVLGILVSGAITLCRGVSGRGRHRADAR